MELIKHIQFMSVFFDSERRLLLYNWKDGNEKLEEKELKEICIELTDTIKAYSPIYLIGDDSNRKCLITLEIQNWVASVIAEACITVGLKSYAIVVPKDLVAHLSTEQTVEEAGQVPFDIKYFNSKEEALAWVKTLEKVKK